MINTVSKLGIEGELPQIDKGHQQKTRANIIFSGKRLDFFI